MSRKERRTAAAVARRNNHPVVKPKAPAPTQHFNKSASGDWKPGMAPIPPDLAAKATLLDGPEPPMCGVITAGKAPSSVLIIAENRGPAPAPFVLHIYRSEPRPEGVLHVAEETDPAHVARIDFPSVDPGKQLEIKGKDLRAVGFDPEINDKGPMVWFRVPRELRGIWYIHKLEWNGYDMLKQKGFMQ